MGVFCTKKGSFDLPITVSFFYWSSLNCCLNKPLRFMFYCILKEYCDVWPD
jgi:hypothetical protein